MVFYTFIWKYFKISILWKHPPFENIHFFKISIFRPLDRPLETWPDVEFRIPSDQLIFGLVFGSGTDCNLWLWDRICYQYFFWLNNDSPDAFLGPPPSAAEKKKATKVITPILEVISSNISQSNFPKKSQSPNHQNVYRTVPFIQNVKCCHPLEFPLLKHQRWTQVRGTLNKRSER